MKRSPTSHATAGWESWSSSAAAAGPAVALGFLGGGGIIPAKALTDGSFSLMEVADAMRSRHIIRTGLFAAAVLALLAPARAAEVDKCLPNDSEIVATINLRQILDSELVKKYALNHLKAAIKDSGEAEKVLEDLGLNPLTDVNSLTVAGPGGDAADKDLFIVHGKFDPKKFADKADEASKQDSHLKITKAGDYTIYEVALDTPGPVSTMYVAVAGPDTILASPGKSYVIDALDKQAGKKKGELNKELAALINKENPKQSLWAVVLSPALGKSAAFKDEKAKEVLSKTRWFTAGVTVTKEVRLDANIAAKDASAADDLKKEINAGLEQVKGLAAVFAAQQPQIAPLSDVLDSLKISTQKNDVKIEGKVSQDVIEKAMKK
jgi:hypothetical protein